MGYTTEHFWSDGLHIVCRFNTARGCECSRLQVVERRLVEAGRQVVVYYTTFDRCVKLRESVGGRGLLTRERTNITSMEELCEELGLNWDLTRPQANITVVTLMVDEKYKCRRW